MRRQCFPQRSQLLQYLEVSSCGHTREEDSARPQCLTHSHVYVSLVVIIFVFYVYIFVKLSRDLVLNFQANINGCTSCFREKDCHSVASLLNFWTGLCVNGACVVAVTMHGQPDVAILFTA